MKDREWQPYGTLARFNTSNLSATGQSPPDTETVSSGSSGLREDYKIGIGVGVGLGLSALLAAVGFWLFRKRSRHAKRTNGLTPRENMVSNDKHTRPNIGNTRADTQELAGGFSELDTATEISSPARRYTSGHWSQPSNQWDHSQWASTPHTSMDPSQARQWELWQQQAYQQQQHQQGPSFEQAHRRSTSDTNTRLSHITTFQPLYEMEQQEVPQELSVPHTGPTSAYTWELGSEPKLKQGQKSTGAEP